MNYLIDPDVFRASFESFPCMAALNKISTEVQMHRFFQDAEAALELEFRRIFNEHYGEDEHPSIRLLQYILSEDGNPEDRVSGCCAVRDEIEQQGDLFPVEPEMIGMLANAGHLGLILVLVGLDARVTRPRRLYDDEFFRAIGKKIPWLEVEWAGRATIEIPHAKFADTDASSSKSREFESKAALWLQDQDSELKCCTPPPKGQIGGAQIDVYGYRRKSAATTAIIGECKLRREGNEDVKPIESREIQQLRRKLIAAREYERSRRRRSTNEKIPTEYEGILISNATNLGDQARKLVDMESEFHLKFIHVDLPSKWETQQDWRILAGSTVYSNEPS